MKSVETDTCHVPCDTQRILESVERANTEIGKLGLARTFAVVIVHEWVYDRDAEDNYYRAQVLFPSGRVLLAVIAHTPEVAGRSVIQLLKQAAVDIVTGNGIFD